METPTCDGDEFIGNNEPTYDDPFFVEVLKFCDAFYGQKAYANHVQEQEDAINEYFLFDLDSCKPNIELGVLDIVTERYDTSVLENIEFEKQKNILGVIKKRINTFAIYLCFIWGNIHQDFLKHASTGSENVYNLYKECLINLHKSITLNSDDLQKKIYTIVRIDYCEFLKQLKCFYDTIAKINEESSKRIIESINNELNQIGLDQNITDPKIEKFFTGKLEYLYELLSPLVTNYQTQIDTAIKQKPHKKYGFSHINAKVKEYGCVVKEWIIAFHQMVFDIDKLKLINAKIITHGDDVPLFTKLKDSAFLIIDFRYNLKQAIKGGKGDKQPPKSNTIQTNSAQGRKLERESYAQQPSNTNKKLDANIESIRDFNSKIQKSTDELTNEIELKRSAENNTKRKIKRVSKNITKDTNLYETRENNKSTSQTFRTIREALQSQYADETKEPNVTASLLGSQFIPKLFDDYINPPSAVTNPATGTKPLGGSSHKKVRSTRKLKKQNKNTRNKKRIKNRNETKKHKTPAKQ